MSLKRQLEQPDSALREFLADNLPHTAAARDIWKEQMAGAELLVVDPVIVGPIFEGSADVGGADGDLMVGGTYLEFKSSIDSKLRQRDLQQIVSYALLDYEDAYGIKEVAIYLARYGRIVRWCLGDLLRVLADAPIDLADLRTTLRAAADEAV